MQAALTTIDEGTGPAVREALRSSKTPSSPGPVASPAGRAARVIDRSAATGTSEVDPPVREDACPSNGTSRKTPPPRHWCPCCNYRTLPERHTSLICRVCFWEDDAFIGDQLDEHSTCNRMTLREARANFASFGACEMEMLKNVLPPEARSQFERRPS